MPSQKNQQQLEEIKAALKDTKAVILTNYAGLSVSAKGELSNAIRQAGGTYSVYKNTLIKLALKEKLGDLPQAAQDALQGQTAILIAPEDPVSPTKALMKFYKDNELPEVKLGFMDGALLTSKDIDNLSKLPGREELLGNLVRQLNAPISSFAQVLRANLQNIVYVVDAIRTSKS